MGSIALEQRVRCGLIVERRGTCTGGQVFEEEYIPLAIVRVVSRVLSGVVVASAPADAVRHSAHVFPRTQQLVDYFASVSLLDLFRIVLVVAANILLNSNTFLILSFDPNMSISQKILPAERERIGEQGSKNSTTNLVGLLNI